MKGLASLGIALILFPAFGVGLVVELINLYGCNDGEARYASSCEQRVFLWDKVYVDGTFPIVFQEKGGRIQNTNRRRWELVPVPGEKNHFRVRLCGTCSYGQCCVFWSLRQHWTYSELVATYSYTNAVIFDFRPDAKGFKIYACNRHKSCRYEMTWEYLNSDPRIKWLSFQHYRNEGVKWNVRVKKITSPATQSKAKELGIY